ncbi:AhpD family alkylhydroperoxidase [Paenibacillus mucilaginosus]|uniref:carboxymuconolactone decarboxylase family protein n=1 Tax=Paenibacillus mucilaginosus TaxID=61624 RepID=UPI003D19216D
MQMESKTDSYKIGVGHMKEHMPGMVEAYHGFTGSCFAPGALEEKQKQLIALGIALYVNNEVCTMYHVEEALSKGASKQEVLEAMAVAAAVGSGHILSQGVTRVQQALGSLTYGKQ